MTAPAVLSNTSSSSTRTAASSSAAPGNNNSNSNEDGATSPALALDRGSDVCYYCTHLKLLRDVIPPKRCDYCRVWKCQFCTLKFPLLSVRKKALPAIMKSNTRVCVGCFSQHWQAHDRNASANALTRRDSVGSKRTSMAATDLDTRRSSSFIGDSSRSRDSLASFSANRRESMAIDSAWAAGDESARRSFVATAANTDAAHSHRRARSLSTLSSRGSNAPAAPSAAAAPPAAPSAAAAPPAAPHAAPAAPVASRLISAVDLWISIFAATILVVIVVLEGYSLQQRVCFCVATYAVFLTLHPWFHAPSDANSTGTMATASTAVPTQQAKPNSNAPPQNATSAALPLATDAALSTATQRALPAEYKAHVAKMAQTLAFYLSDACPWNVVKTTSGGIVSELAANDTPFPVFKIELFITGVAMTDFVDYLDRMDVASRARWDLNVAAFAVVETFTDVPTVRVVHNTQQSFLGGLVAARDFVLLAVRDGASISFSSVEHTRVPPAPRATRGHVFLSSFHCHEATDIDGAQGFILTYVCQVDIRGSLPPKLLYSGSIDNMVKMIKVFKRPQKLLR